MGTSSSLAEAAGKVGKVLDAGSVKSMVRAAGMAGKKVALEEAGKSLGGDRRFSGFKRMGALSAGFDEAASSATINYRPAGGWKLAESGRRGSKRVRRGGVIFRTPAGPRWAFRSGPSRGLNTITNAHQATGPKAAKAADEALEKAIAGVF
jgi:hypothetical protein